jgi:hypothetical protein
MIEVTVFSAFPGGGKPGEFFFEILGGVVARSRTPFFAAARRVLEAFPESADDWIVMRHVNTDDIALRAKVGIAAGLTVEETGDAPRFRPWKPYS